MQGDPKIYETLKMLDIQFEYFEHPPLHNIEESKKYGRGVGTTKCKNLFFRNHKGNKHFLVILEHQNNLAIKDLEALLGKGKLTMASEKRLAKYLKTKPGTVSPFGLIHDIENHVRVFIDKNLQNALKVSFHPNLNTASLVIGFSDFLKFMDLSGNQYDFIDLY